MSFVQTFGADYLTLNPDIVFGTAMLGRQFGVIKTAAVKRTGLREEIINDAGALRMVLIKNPGWELLLTCAFDITVQPPGLLEQITLPFVGVQGHVMEGASIQWEGNGERMITIPVNSWDTMQDATAYRLDPSTGLLIEIGRAGNPPVLSPSLTALVVTSSTVTLGIGLVAGAEKYRVEWSSDGQTWTFLGVTDLNYIEDVGLSPRTTRRYRARGQDGEAGGPWSDVVIVTTAAADAAPATAPVISLTSTASAFQLMWTVVTDAEDYETEWRMLSSDPWQPLTITTNRSATLPGVLPDEYRWMRVRARNSLGAGPWAEIRRRFFAIPSLTVQPINRDAGTFRISGDNIWGVRVRWSLLPDLASPTDVPYLMTEIGTGKDFPVPNVPGDPVVPQGLRIYWQARQSNDLDYITEWGPITSMISLPRTPSGLAIGPGSNYALSWNNPGGAFDGYRVYKQTGSGPLVLHAQDDGPSLLPPSKNQISALYPVPSLGQKLYVVTVRDSFESPLPTPVVVS